MDDLSNNNLTGNIPFSLLQAKNKFVLQFVEWYNPRSH